MIGSIHQPNFLPWVPYFVKMAVGDLHVHLNHVQYSKNGWTNRCCIFLDPENKKYITIPVIKKDSSLPISEVRVSQNWKPTLRKARTTLSHKWSKRDGLEHSLEILNKVEDLCSETENLCSINVQIIDQICSFLNINTRVVDSSSVLNVDKKSGEDLVEHLCDSLKITSYISGTGAKNYMSHRVLEKINYKPIGIDQINLEDDKSGILDFISTYGSHAPEQFRLICRKV